MGERGEIFLFPSPWIYLIFQKIISTNACQRHHHSSVFARAHMPENKSDLTAAAGSTRAEQIYGRI